MPGVQAVNTKNDKGEDLDMENADFQREMLRPAEIKEDVKLMEQRRRVSKILNSEAFHRELNKILDQQLKEGATCGGKAGSGNEVATAAALMEISNLLLPQARLGCSVFNRGATMPIIPINDLRVTDKHISKVERLLRCKLASVYRLVDLHGWATGMILHASVRIGQDEFLVGCHGLMNHEVTARSLLRIDLNGEIDDDQGRIDMPTWVLHSSVHHADPMYRCVLHVRTPAVIAVSAMKTGLVNICEEAAMLGMVPVYEWGSASEGTDDWPERLNLERAALGSALGNSKCIFVRNEGLLVRGKTVEDAWLVLSLAVHACETQVRLASSIGSDSVVTLPPATTNSSAEPNIEHDMPADLRFEALMRALDATGYRTGYLFRHSPIIADQQRHHPSLKQQQSYPDDGNLADMEDEDDDVEIPPSATSFSTRLEGDEACRPRGPQQQWLLNMPNDYVREEVEEPGPQNASKKAVIWRAVSADKRQTSGLVETCKSPNQFAPQGCDPNELRQQQRKVKSKYFRDETSAGHQSKVLRDMESAQEIVGEQLATEPTGRVVLVGAVSKGIIDKRHRNDPSVYQSCFSPNPFDRMTENDLRQYERQVYGLPSTEGDAALSGDAPGISVDEAPTLAKSATTDFQDDPVVAPTHVLHEEIAPLGVDIQQPLQSTPTTSLSPTAAAGIDTIRSDTSGADMSHDDTEKEGGTQKVGTDKAGSKKKKKKLKEMFSFRKSKK